MAPDERSQRSEHWDRVSAVVERTRRNLERYDPESEPAARCVDDGLAPIVSAYVEASQADGELAPVERALLKSALNDWLVAYAAARGAAFDGRYTVHEFAVNCSDHGGVRAAADAILGLG